MLFFISSYTTAAMELEFKPLFYSLLLRSNNSTINNNINPLNAELNPICQALALLGAHHIFHVSRLRVNTEDADMGCDPMLLGEWLNLNEWYLDSSPSGSNAPWP